MDTHGAEQALHFGSVRSGWARVYRDGWAVGIVFREADGSWSAKPEYELHGPGPFDGRVFAGATRRAAAEQLHDTVRKP